MNDIIKPDYITDLEWETAKRKLPKLRSKYERDANDSSTKPSIAEHFRTKLSSNQFLMIEILIDMRQPTDPRDTVVKDGEKLFHDLCEITNKIGLKDA
jgi:hypothetical protein